MLEIKGFQICVNHVEWFNRKPWCMYAIKFKIVLIYIYKSGAVTNLPPLQESRPEIPKFERRTQDNPYED